MTVAHVWTLASSMAFCTPLLTLEYPEAEDLREHEIRAHDSEPIALCNSAFAAFKVMC